MNHSKKLRVLTNALHQKKIIWLLVALVLQLLVGGKWNVELAPWISLTLFLKFSRNQIHGWHVWLGFPPFAVVTGIAMVGIVPIPFPYFYLFIIGISLFVYSGFLLDRWALRNQEKDWALFVYPSFLVALEGAISFGPYGTWNSLAYTQSNNLYLIQLASVTGIWGLTFLIGLTASVFCKVWEEQFRNRSSLRLLGVAMIALVFIHLYGFWRIKSYSSNDIMKVGAINVVMPPGSTLQEIALQFVVKGSPRDQVQLYRKTTRNAQRELLTKTAYVASQANVVFWPEANAIVLEDDEKQYIDALINISSEKRAFIFAPLATIYYGKKKMANKVIIVGPETGVIGEYVKSVVPPGEPSIKGSGKLTIIDTPYGRLGTAICFDMDFPDLILQASKGEANALIVPALDWREIGSIHATMAKFRGVENGISIVRYATSGVSMATNPVGQALATSDYFTTTESTFIVTVPTAQVQTIYSKLGNWLLYACAIFLTVIIIFKMSTVFRNA